MFEWPEELQMVRDAVRQFVDNEIRPHREELEHGDLPPYDLLRKLYATFGMVTALGVSVGLTATAINSKGTIAQRKRWARDLLTLDKIGAWAITEPNSGSDAFGQMVSTARRDG